MSPLQSFYDHHFYVKCPWKKDIKGSVPLLQAALTRNIWFYGAWNINRGEIHSVEKFLPENPPPPPYR